MPIIVLKTSRQLTDNTMFHLAKELTNITADQLGKQADVTVVRIESASKESSWFVGGLQHSTNATIAELSIKITAQTNTSSQKSGWIKAAWVLLQDLLGESLAPNYISIIELDSQAWGYSGLTQEFRRNIANE